LLTIALFGDAEALLGATGAFFGAKVFGARVSFLSNYLARSLVAAAVVPAP